MVAGAAHADLVEDLRGAVDRAIADGATLETFRAEFDEIVSRHGWSYKGGRNWRTNVIYGTNLRTSYAAGRYQQMKDIAERRPYWRYRHSDASERPRHEHVQWDGLVLRHDDPWWQSHYPPNGWGCKCFVESINERALKRSGCDGPDTAPPINTRPVTVGEKGPSPRTVDVPEGIDPGWAYAPGQSAAAPDFERELRRNMGAEYREHLMVGRKRLHGADWPEMTDPQVATVRAFTTENDEWGHRKPNKALWDAAKPGGPPVPPKYEAYRRTLNAALDRLPDYPAKGLKRGLPTLSKTELARYKPGRIVTEHGFTGTSIDEGFPGRVQFKIDGLHGKRIEQISAHPEEREVLFKAGTRFRVINKHEENGITHIHLEEVDDD